MTFCIYMMIVTLFMAPIPYSKKTLLVFISQHVEILTASIHANRDAYIRMPLDKKKSDQKRITKQKAWMMYKPSVTITLIPLCRLNADPNAASMELVRNKIVKRIYYANRP
jgi:hypothetical protein